MASTGGYHLVFPVAFDLDAMERDASRDRNPRHVYWRVREQLGAVVHQPPGPRAIRRTDQLLGRLAGTPAAWAQARIVVQRAQPGDAVLAHDVDGFILALVARLRRRRLRIIAMMNMVSGVRLETLSRRLRIHRQIQRLIVTVPKEAEDAPHTLGIDPDRVIVARDQTDLRFFCPGPAQDRPRPLIFSAGLEQRDYVTLAAAVENLDVDVRVCAISPNASARTRVAMPEATPPNMAFEPYPWIEFRQAYRDAAVVVVPLLASDFSPGTTVMVEAMACRRPLIVTQIGGVTDELVELGCALGVPIGDPTALRAAIEWVLAHPAEADAMAARGHQRALAEHSSDELVQTLVDLLRGARS